MDDLKSDYDILPISANTPRRQNYTVQWVLSHLPKPRLSQLLAIPNSVVYAILPELLRTGFKHESTTQHRWTKSSWMDGLRGIAAFCVFNFHFLMSFTFMPKVGFGWNKKFALPLNLPIVRLLHEGATAVNIFFIISGYVVSTRALELIASGQRDKVMQGLSSSVFRRGFRLYLPVLCIMIFTATATQLGMFDYSRALMEDPTKFNPPGLGHLPSLKHYKKLRWQLNFLVKEFFETANITNNGPFYNHHDAHLWTIPYEYRGSLFIYLAIVGLSSCRPYIRLAGLVLVGLVHLFWNHWEGPLFFTGAAMAQLAAMGHTQASSQCSDDRRPERSIDATTCIEKQNTGPCPLPIRPWKRGLRAGLFSFALYLMSFPVDNLTKPAAEYMWLNPLIPWWYGRKHRFVTSIGTILFIYLLETVPSQRSSLWMKVLNSRPPQYLGRIMFSFYLVHGPVLHSIGYMLPRLIWAQVGFEPYWRYVAGLTGGWLLSLLLCLWAAEVFDREVVARCTRLTAWLERRCLLQSS